GAAPPVEATGGDNARHSVILVATPATDLASGSDCSSHLRSSFSTELSAPEQEALRRGSAPGPAPRESRIMSDPVRPPDGPHDHIQPIHAELQHHEDETANRDAREARRQQLDQRMGERFDPLRSLGRRLFTPGESPSDGDTFETLARHLLEFNETLREADAEYP